MDGHRPDTKLIPSWLVGPRDGETACEFLDDLAGRIMNRVLVTTNGLHAYALTSSLHLSSRRSVYGVLRGPWIIEQSDVSHADEQLSAPEGLTALRATPPREMKSLDIGGVVA